MENKANQVQAEELFIGNIINKEKDISVDELPEMDLYMDQVISLFESKLNGNNEKLLTKTMINNYSKDKLIGNVNKKKYTKEQILRMLIIYNLKQTLSIIEMRELFAYIKRNQISFKSIYNEIIRIKSLRGKLINSISKSFEVGIDEELSRIMLYSVLSSSFKQLSSQKLLIAVGNTSTLNHEKGNEKVAEKSKKLYVLRARE